MVLINQRKRSRDHQSRLGRAIFEELEERTLFAVQPSPIVGEQLLGSERSCTGIVLTFSQHLDGATAQAVKAYNVLRLFREVRLQEPGNPPAGIVSVPDAKPDGGFDTQRVTLASAMYDDSTQTVTLTPTRAFDPFKYLNLLRASGSGADAILTSVGVPIGLGGSGTAGGDELIQFKAVEGRRISYVDSSGDHVQLQLGGPGSIHALLHVTGDAAPIVFVAGTQAARSVLSGKIIPSGRGTGTAVIQEVIGTATVQDNVSTDPAFHVLSLQP